MLKPYNGYKETNIPWLEEVPSHWESKRLISLFMENKNINSTLESVDAFQFKFGEIVPKKKYEINDELKKTYSKYALVQPLDIMVNGLNLNYDFLTQRVAIVKDNGIITSAYISLRPRNNINSKYYTLLLKSLDSQKIFNGMGSGIRLTLDFPELKKMNILVPLREEQDQIVKYLDWQTSKINTLIKAKKKQIELLKEQKQAVINKAVTKGLDNTVPMKDSGVEWLGQVPDKWVLRSLGSFCTLQNGISEAGDFFTKGFPFVNYGDVYNNFQLPNKIEGLANSNKKQQEIYSVLSGDIFFTRTSETKEDIARSSVAMGTIQQAVFSGFVIRVRPFQNIILKEYSKYYFRNELLRNYFVKEMNIVTRASLSQGVLRNLPVILPSLDEQHTIGNYLQEKISTIEQAILVIEKEIELVIEYKTSLISSVVTGKVDVRDVVVPEFEVVEDTVSEDIGEDLDNEEMEG